MSRDLLNIVVKGPLTISTASFSILMGILSGPGDFEVFSLFVYKILQHV